MFDGRSTFHQRHIDHETERKESKLAAAKPMSTTFRKQIFLLVELAPEFTTMAIRCSREETQIFFDANSASVAREAKNTCRHMQSRMLMRGCVSGKNTDQYSERDNRARRGRAFQGSAACE